MKIDDEVEAVRDYGEVRVGMRGILKSISTGSLGVMWPRGFTGHYLEGLLKGEDANRGWHVPKDYVKVVELCSSEYQIF